MPPSPEVRSGSENPDGDDEDLEEMYEVEREIVLNEDDYNPENDDDEDAKRKIRRLLLLLPGMRRPQLLLH